MTGLLLGGCLLIAGLALIKTSATSDDAKALAVQIQQERARNIRLGCEQQNQRHDDTIRALDRLIALVPASGRARAEQGRAGTLLLINALAPKRDCVALVRNQVDQ